MLVSAALLFLVQPMFARMVLPLLGGSPAAWNTAVVFYQVALLAGYTYAHVVTRWLSLRAQALVHAGVLVAPFAVLPIGLSERWTPPAADHPVVWLLAVLCAAVGLPFFVVSSTTPLLQRWFISSGHSSAQNPYTLYSVSNFGSLIALLGYPLIVEKWLPLREQSRWWAWGYVGLTVLVGACAAAVWRAGRLAVQAPSAGPPPETTPVAWRDRWRWIALAAMPVSFMLSLTTYISTDIASIPLLWVIPLALYLLTFMLTFGPRPVVPTTWLVRALAAALAMLVFLLAAAKDLTTWPVMAAHVGTFALAALVAHGELARRRPAPWHLTDFYLSISLGGAIGGILNALVAPLIFDQVAEYPLTLMLAAWLLPRLADTAETPAPRTRGRRRAEPRSSKRSDLPRRTGSFQRPRVFDVLWPAALFSVAALLVLALLEPDGGLRWGSRAIAFGVPAVLSLAFVRRPVRFALGLGAIVLASGLYSGKGTYLHTDRTFFGISRVVLFATGGYHLLEHGNTLHGAQSLEEARRHEPLTYYHASGPLGDIFKAFWEQPTFDEVAVIGLGTGSVSCYRERGQLWTFYEIDPAVVRIATDRRYFTFLDMCAPGAPIVVGDARVRIADARPSQYGMIILDAYSSDAIPLHLITREAIQLYLDKLAPGGLLVFNVSNRNFRLESVLASIAADLGLAGRARSDQQLTEAEQNRGKLASQWVVLARRPEDLGQVATDARWTRLHAPPGARAWTDDFNNLLSVINWSR